jgi:TonB family protein
MLLRATIPGALMPALVLAAQLASAQAIPTFGTDPMTEPQLRASLAILDSLKQTMASMRTNAPAFVAASTLTDVRGQTFADDLRRYCLPATEQEAAAQQFADAAQALDRGELAASGQLQRALYHRLEVNAIQCKVIGDYWRDIVGHPRDWQPYVAMLHANGITPHYAANIESLERTFQLKVRNGLFIDAIGGTLPLLEGIRWRAEKLDIEALEAKAASADFHGLYSKTASAPCTPAAAHSSGKAKPSVDSSRPRPSLVYPEESRHIQESGTVFVVVTVAATGCVRLASVLGSTGYAKLDRAGVEYAMTLRFLPAEQDGIAIERDVSIPIQFTLNSSN